MSIQQRRGLRHTPHEGALRTIQEVLRLENQDEDVLQKGLELPHDGPHLSSHTAHPSPYRARRDAMPQNPVQGVRGHLSHQAEVQSESMLHLERQEEEVQSEVVLRRFMCARSGTEG